MLQLENYILVIPNIVPDELCDAIIKEYEALDIWEDAAINSGVNRHSDKKTRNCEITKISKGKTDQAVFKCASSAFQEYINVFPKCNITQDSGYDLLKYSEGGFYVQHIDSIENATRSVACSFLLNDDFEGGEFGFFDGKIKHTLKKGSAIMFPSNFMYPHEITPVTSGTRYSIITWFK
jgi:predicted 2-oxoglutarate/Fe(II)-dependent dioxygenase YbiX